MPPTVLITLRTGALIYTTHDWSRNPDAAMRYLSKVRARLAMLTYQVRSPEAFNCLRDAINRVRKRHDEICPF